MTRRFLLEQLNRAEATAKYEIIAAKKYNFNNGTWSLHEEGHIMAIDFLRLLITDNSVINVKKLKKLINQRFKYNLMVIKDLEIKYNYWENNDESFDEFCNNDDGNLYFMLDGMNCEFEILIRVLNKKYYYNKKCYSFDDWNIIFNNE